MAQHEPTRRLTPHPAGLSSIVTTTLVVLAAFLAGGADAAAPPSSGRVVASVVRGRPRTAAKVASTPRPAGPSATAVSPDSMYDAADSLAEACEASRHAVGRGDRGLLHRGEAHAAAPRPRLRPRHDHRQGRPRRPAPPPVVPRAPPPR